MPEGVEAGKPARGVWVPASFPSRALRRAVHFGIVSQSPGPGTPADWPEQLSGYLMKGRPMVHVGGFMFKAHLQRLEEQLRKRSSVPPPPLGPHGDRVFESHREGVDRGGG